MKSEDTKTFGQTINSSRFVDVETIFEVRLAIS